MMSLSLKRKAPELPVNGNKKPKGIGSITAFFGAPKPVSTTAKVNGNSTGPSSSPAASSWDKDAWVKKLSEEQKQLLALEIGTLHESWLKELRDEITSESFLGLKRFLRTEAQSGKKIYPPSEDVYSWYVSLRIVMLCTLHPHGPS
jgi:uracil-DNA glycosylase